MGKKIPKTLNYRIVESSFFKSLRDEVKNMSLEDLDKIIGIIKPYHKKRMKLQREYPKYKIKSNFEEYAGGLYMKLTAIQTAISNGLYSK